MLFNQTTNIPKATQKSVHENIILPPEDSEVPDSQEESVSLDQEQDEEVSFHPSLTYPAHPMPQVIPSMYMPYVEGPRIDWAVNDGLYHRFPKWRLKCKNILECKLAALLDKQQCKRVIVWSGDLGIAQYVSWILPKDELSLNTI